MDKRGKKDSRLFREVIFCCAVIAAGTLIAVNFSGFLGAQGVPLKLFVPVFFFLFCPYVFFGSESVREIASSAIEKLPPALPYVIYLAYILAFFAALNSRLLDVRGFLAVLLYLIAPYACLRAGRPGVKEKLDASSAGAILLVWLPVELDLLPAYRLTSLLQINMTLFLFIFVARVPRLGFAWSMDGRDFAEAVLGYLLFAAIAVPLAVFTGFISWGPGSLTPLNVAASGAAIFFAVAIPEEVFFRGIIQNLLESTLSPKTQRAPLISLLAVSIIFGLAHAGSRDWRYVLLASIAGVFYGGVYLRRRSTVASALTHMLVDTAWSVLFVTHWRR